MKKNKKLIPKVTTTWKYYIRSLLRSSIELSMHGNQLIIFRPKMWWSMIQNRINNLKKILSDESEYEHQYVYGTEIYNDFNFNVGRKIHTLKSAIKVDHYSYSYFSILILRFGPA